MLERLQARDSELPNEVSLHYWLYSINLDSGKINWKSEFYAGHPPDGNRPDHSNGLKYAHQLNNVLRGGLPPRFDFLAVHPSA